MKDFKWLKSFKKLNSTALKQDIFLVHILSIYNYKDWLIVTLAKTAGPIISANLEFADFRIRGLWTVLCTRQLWKVFWGPQGLPVAAAGFRTLFQGKEITSGFPPKPEQHFKPKMGILRLTEATGHHMQLLRASENTLFFSEWPKSGFECPVECPSTSVSAGVVGMDPHPTPD